MLCANDLNSNQKNKLSQKTAPRVKATAGNSKLKWFLNIAIPSIKFKMNSSIFKRNLSGKKKNIFCKLFTTLSFLIAANTKIRAPSINIISKNPIKLNKYEFN